VVVVVTAELLERTDLAALTLDELAALYGGDDETDALITAECDWRDQADAQRARQRARRHLDPVTVEWREAAHAPYLAAEAACNGELVRDPLDAPFEDAFALWSGTDQFVARWASEELRNYWQEHPRNHSDRLPADVARAKAVLRRRMDARGGASAPRGRAGIVGGEQGDVWQLRRR
jgi:hypothetical protein